MNDQCKQAPTWMRVEVEPFELWMATDLRQRFGEIERLPDELLKLVETVPTQG